ncbi:MAG: MarR family transcriptional regulator [Methanomassiliicoccaceae archaeon]|nr:MarR family transcriptional regulator [Methanomassiliicoccaceae archaeon]MCL2145624.1 MarR family transcriptional regulator [Methanomassiliicoccaceae archaeon]
MKYSKFQNSNESPGLLFWQASVLWQRKIKDALRPFDITHTQFVILAVTHELNEVNSCVTQNDISDFSMIDVMTVSKTLRLLEKKNLITRENHPTDTRAKRILNTIQGEEIIKTVNPIVEAVDNEFFFSDKETLAVFIGLLSQLKRRA